MSSKLQVLLLFLSNDIICKKKRFTETQPENPFMDRTSIRYDQDYDYNESLRLDRLKKEEQEMLRITKEIEKLEQAEPPKPTLEELRNLRVAKLSK